MLCYSAITVGGLEGCFEITPHSEDHYSHKDYLRDCSQYQMAGGLKERLNGKFPTYPELIIMA